MQVTLNWRDFTKEFFEYLLCESLINASSCTMYYVTHNDKCNIWTHIGGIIQ
jgi:hypothetical protein